MTANPNLNPNDLRWENRRAARRKVMGTALILGPNLEARCVIRDLSSGGAKIEVPAAVKLPLAFNLLLLKISSSRHVRLKWRKGDFAGVQFVLPVATDAKQRA